MHTHTDATWHQFYSSKMARTKQTRRRSGGGGGGQGGGRAGSGGGRGGGRRNQGGTGTGRGRGGTRRRLSCNLFIPVDSRSRFTCFAINIDTHMHVHN